MNNGINEETTQELIVNFKRLEDDEPRDDINFYINSFDGEIHGLLAIYDVIKSLECDINPIVLGKCMSAGCYLLMSGTGKRKAYKKY